MTAIRMRMVRPVAAKAAVISVAPLVALCIALCVGFAPNVALASEGGSLGAGAVSVQDSATAQAISTGKASSKSVKASGLSSASSRKPVYRIYNPYTGEHFYTASKAERNVLVELDWRYEGVAWMAPRKSGDAVFRLFNRKTKDHLYTADADERKALAKRGWRYEGVCWRSAKAEASTSVKVYRELNKRTRTGMHFFTIDRPERNSLAHAGWRHEGTAFYGYKVSSSFEDDMNVWEPGISGDEELDRQLKDILATHSDLQSCFWYVVGFGYISGNRFFSNPHILPDSTTIAFAKEILANHGGNCYRFACLFSWLARGLGYQTNVVSGWVPSAGGGAAPHGWVEIYEDGVTRIYDPDLAHELPGYNWFGCTYATAPTTYGSW